MISMSFDSPRAFLIKLLFSIDGIFWIISVLEVDCLAELDFEADEGCLLAFSLVAESRLFGPSLAESPFDAEFPRGTEFPCGEFIGVDERDVFKPETSWKRSESSAKPQRSSIMMGQCIILYENNTLQQSIQSLCNKALQSPCNRALQSI